MCFQSSQSAARSSVKDRLGFSKPAPAEGKVLRRYLSDVFRLRLPDRQTDRALFFLASSPQVFSTSTGLTKTFYNPAALKPGQKGAMTGTAPGAEDALKKKKQVGHEE